MSKDYEAFDKVNKWSSYLVSSKSHTELKLTFYSRVLNQLNLKKLNISVMFLVFLPVLNIIEAAGIKVLELCVS